VQAVLTVHLSSKAPFYLFNSHLIKVFIGLFCLIAFCFIPYEIYKYYSKWALIAIVGVLILTLFFAPNIKGAGRWLDLGIITVQPADIAKLVLIIHLAALIEQKQEFINDFKKGFLYAFIWIMLVSSLIFIQPNISTGFLLVIISLILLYVGGAKIKHIALSSLFSMMFAGGFAMLFTHSRSRILAFIKSFSDGGDLNIQVKQALYGLGSGGLTGVGIGNSKQNNLFLPEAYGDFIFAILGEEMGFIGSVIILSAIPDSICCRNTDCKKSQGQIRPAIGVRYYFFDYNLCICECCCYNRFISYYRTAASFHKLWRNINNILINLYWYTY
jgi:cell division protein FtsW